MLALFERLKNPPGLNIIGLAKNPNLGPEFALAHIELMRQHDKSVSAAHLALEQIIKKRQTKL